MPLMIARGAVRPRPRSLTSMPRDARWRISPPRSKASTGILQVDGYGSYKGLARRHPQIQLAFCLAHARRKFVAVYKATHAPLARDVIAALSEVYAIEARIRGRSAAERRAVRQAETKPIMEALKARLMTALAELPSRSSLVEAIKYMLGHWAGLTLFLEDGRIEVDTNTVERTMRPIALGRKNALFAGSESGARTWAILASLINTAKLNDLDPQTYLADVLERMISGRTPVNRLDELLAWNWKAARAAMATAAAYRAGSRTTRPTSDEHASTSQSAFEKVRPGLLIGIRTGLFRTSLLVGRDVGDHALLEGDLLDLTRHMAQVYQHPIDFSHPHERVLIQQAGQRPLRMKSARVQSLRDDARLRTGCALADPEPGT